jgi:hypothetical protein
MYLLERRASDLLASRAEIAQKVGSPAAPDGCIPGSAGKGGSTLVLRCQAPAADVFASETLEDVDWSPFEAVVVASPDEVWRCKSATKWPNDCEKLARVPRRQVQ